MQPAANEIAPVSRTDTVVPPGHAPIRGDAAFGQFILQLIPAAPKAPSQSDLAPEQEGAAREQDPPAKAAVPAQSSADPGAAAAEAGPAISGHSPEAPFIGGTAEKNYDLTEGGKTQAPRVEDSGTQGTSGKPKKTTAQPALPQISPSSEATPPAPPISPIAIAAPHPSIGVPAQEQPSPAMQPATASPRLLHNPLKSAVAPASTGEETQSGEGEPAKPRAVVHAVLAAGAAGASRTTPAPRAMNDFKDDLKVGASQLPDSPRVSAGADSALPGIAAAAPSSHTLATAGEAAAALSHSAQATFERMDGAPAPQLVTSTPQRLSVGIRDSSLGWMEIRAHTAAGQVAAVVATGSIDAHTAISSQLPAMREYLAGQHIRLDTLASEQFSSPGGSGHSSQNGNQGSKPESGQPSARPQSLASEPEDEALSYISIRV